MKRENKIVSILAGTTLLFSGGAFLINNALKPSGNDLNFNDVAHFYSKTSNAAYYSVFSADITVQFEGAADKDMYSALLEVKEKLEYLDDLGGTSSKGVKVSNLYDLNATNVDARLQINEELYRILLDTKRLYDYSSGIFDVNAGNLYRFLKNELRYVRDGEAPIDMTELTKHITQGKWSTFDEALLLEEENGNFYATRKHAETRVDLGGYLKGYATEYIRSIARKYDRNIFVNAGASSLAYVGNNESEEKTKNIILTNPRIDNSCVTGLEAECIGTWKAGSDFHLSTSGDYIQGYVDSAGKRWHHLVNPIDGSMRQDRGILSILSTDKTSYLDALSTILFIADPNDYTTILNKFTHAKVDVVYGIEKTDKSDLDKVIYIQSGTTGRFDVSAKYQ